MKVKLMTAQFHVRLFYDITYSFTWKMRQIQVQKTIVRHQRKMKDELVDGSMQWHVIVVNVRLTKYVNALFTAFDHFHVKSRESLIIVSDLTTVRSLFVHLLQSLLTASGIAVGSQSQSIVIAVSLILKFVSKGRHNKSVQFFLAKNVLQSSFAADHLSRFSASNIFH